MPKHFQKGHDPRRHLLGATKSPVKRARADKAESLMNALRKDVNAVAKTVNYVLTERQFPDGEMVSPNVWVKLLEVYLDRVLGKPIDPNKALSVQPVFDVSNKSPAELIQALGGRDVLEKAVNDA